MPVPGQPAVGWRVDGLKTDKTAFYSAFDGNAGFWGNQAEPAMLLDAPNRAVSDNSRLSEGKLFFTCAIGVMPATPTKGQYLGGIQWGYYIWKNGKLTADPVDPVPAPVIPPELKAALDRWNALQIAASNPNGVLTIT